jgi:hypothetical protein
MSRCLGEPVRPAYPSGDPQSVALSGRGHRRATRARAPEVARIFMAATPNAGPPPDRPTSPAAPGWMERRRGNDPLCNNDCHARPPRTRAAPRQTENRRSGEGGASAPATLLAKCLPGRDKRRLGPARPHVFAPKWQTPAVAAGSRHPQEARIMAISRAFRWSVNRVNSFP